MRAELVPRSNGQFDTQGYACFWNISSKGSFQYYQAKEKGIIVAYCFLFSINQSAFQFVAFHFISLRHFHCFSHIKASVELIPVSQAMDDSRINKAQQTRKYECTVGQNNQEYRLKYWATYSSVRSFARTAH